MSLRANLFDNPEPEEHVVQLYGKDDRLLTQNVSRYLSEGLRRGDGLLVIFNDPLPCVDHQSRAVKMSIEMREEISNRIEKWRSLGHELGFGVGIACGHATLGCVGFEGRFQYSATGTVVNLASRLCDQALHGQILVDVRVHTAIQPLVATEPAGELFLKGLHRSVKAFNVTQTTISSSAAEGTSQVPLIGSQDAA